MADVAGEKQKIAHAAEHMLEDYQNAVINMNIVNLKLEEEMQEVVDELASAVTRAKYAMNYISG